MWTTWSFLTTPLPRSWERGWSLLFKRENIPSISPSTIPYGELLMNNLSGGMLEPCSFFLWSYWSWSMWKSDLIPLRQFPVRQFQLCQHWPNWNWQSRKIPKICIDQGSVSTIDFSYVLTNTMIGFVCDSLNGYYTMNTRWIQERHFLWCSPKLHTWLVNPIDQSPSTTHIEYHYCKWPFEGLWRVNLNISLSLIFTYSLCTGPWLLPTIARNMNKFITSVWIKNIWWSMFSSGGEIYLLFSDSHRLQSWL